MTGTFGSVERDSRQGVVAGSVILDKPSRGDVDCVSTSHLDLVIPAEVALAMKCEEFLSSNSKLAKLTQINGTLAKLGLQVRREKTQLACQKSTGNWTSKMARTRKTSKKDPADEFEAVARRHGCDDGKECFERKRGKIAAAKPAPKRRGGK